MNYSQFLNMFPEASLMVVLLITFIADFCSSKSADRKWFNPLVCLLMLTHICFNIYPTEAAEAFGGMYTTGPAAGVLKTILALGTLIVMVQAKEWLSREDTAFKEAMCGMGTAHRGYRNR
jgi:NADH-quinone oxidoreductase subunit N